MTCLTLDTLTVREAIAEQAGFVVVHHPLPFRPMQRIVTTTAAGQSLWRLIGAGISIYSPHTAWDNADGGSTTNGLPG